MLRSRFFSSKKRIALSLMLICVFLILHSAGRPAFADERAEMLEHLVGVWRMDPRTLTVPGARYIQEDGTVSITDVLPDGRLRVMARITTRGISESEMRFNEPGCDNTVECYTDSATEGVGSLFRNTLYIDWFSEGWIDDVMKIDGNVMTGDDGNGLIRLVKEE